MSKFNYPGPIYLNKCPLMRSIKKGLNEKLSFLDWMQEIRFYKRNHCNNGNSKEYQRQTACKCIARYKEGMFTAEGEGKLYFDSLQKNKGKNIPLGLESCAIDFTDRSFKRILESYFSSKKLIIKQK